MSYYGKKEQHFDVNGKADPLFTWLKEQAPADQDYENTKSFEGKGKVLKPFVKLNDVKWNFRIFLIDRNGNFKARYSSAYKPERLENDIIM